MAGHEADRQPGGLLPGSEVLGTLPDDLGETWQHFDEVEREGYRLGAEMQVLSDAYDQSCHYQGACFGRGRLLRHDAELKRRSDEAYSAWRKHHGGVEYPKKLELTTAILGRDEFDDLQKAAAVQGLFRSGLENRSDYSREFYESLVRLNEALVPGELIMVNRPDQRGLFMVVEPGIRVRIVEHQAHNSIYPRVSVKTGALTGTYIRGDLRSSHGLYLEALSPPTESGAEGVEIYGLKKDSTLDSDPISLLSTGFIDPECNPSEGFAIGAEAIAERMRHFRENETLISFMLILAARLHGIVLREGHTLPAKEAKAITTHLKDVVARRTMVSVVKRENQTGVYRQETWGGSTTVDLTHEDGFVLGRIADMLGISEKQLRNHTLKAINALDEAILDGKEDAAKRHYVEVGRERLDRFMKEMFPAA